MLENVDLKYPIGKFIKPVPITKDLCDEYIHDIECFPAMLRNETERLSEQQLDTPYRPEGWTIRQVVHHCADSHMNSLMRFKLALTENKPSIKPYFEARWAELSDSKNMAIEPALQMLDGIHARWVFLLQSMSTDDMKRSFIHPEHGKEMRLDEVTALYAWHGKHHLAHITNLKSHEQWH